MNLFDSLVGEALKNQPTLAKLRPVVEKELLHHDILKVLSQHKFLESLTFIGGTALRSCYGAVRLSEDLDFTGGHNFSRESLLNMGEFLAKTLHQKYGFEVEVVDPKKEEGGVSTWKVRIETRPESKHLPAQRVHIDICSIPSYEKQPMMLLNPYSIDMGTRGLVLQVQSREEIYADKLLAFALRINRIKHRDVWDILWLHQQRIKPNLSLIPLKLEDRHIEQKHFLSLMEERINALENDHTVASDFTKEMKRFLPFTELHIIEQNNLWPFIIFLLKDLKREIEKIF